MGHGLAHFFFMNARDKRTFDFIEAQMQQFAGLYGLPFKGLLTIYKQKFARNIYGVCHWDGRIGIRIRWATGRPLHSYAIIDTMAHELAHLRHRTHSRKWFSLHAAILGAMACTDLLNQINRRLKP